MLQKDKFTQKELQALWMAVHQPSCLKGRMLAAARRGATKAENLMRQREREAVTLSGWQAGRKVFENPKGPLPKPMHEGEYLGSFMEQFWQKGFEAGKAGYAKPYIVEEQFKIPNVPSIDKHRPQHYLERK